jgi:hypothetical protein
MALQNNLGISRVVQFSTGKVGQLSDGKNNKEEFKNYWCLFFK